MSAPEPTNASVPPLCGADYELGNFISGATGETAYRASRALLAEVDGYGSFGGIVTGGWNQTADATSMDWGRKFLRNGGCAYVDLNHLEICIPEVRSARDHVAAVRAMYRLAQQAADSLNLKLPEGERVHLLANNSDGQGNSYGSHLNFLMARATYDRVLGRRLHEAVLLASYQASSIVFTGLGKVGSELDAPAVNYQLSQRADFVRMLLAPQTTWNRPLVNTRDEPLCGRPRYQSNSAAADFARLHVICYDQNLCQTAAFLKVGVMQILLAMLAEEEIEHTLLLEDPVEAIHRWSHDIGLQATARLLNGSEITALDWQRRFHEVARRFVERGGGEGLVPDAREILDFWGDTLELLAAGRHDVLARRLDWVLKLALLEQARTGHQIEWAAPALKHLDQLYSQLDPTTGLFWACERDGAVDCVVTEQHVLEREFSPPVDTRAWARGQLLGLSQPHQLDSVDWDLVRYRFFSRTGKWRYFEVRLDNPLGFTRTTTETAFPEGGTLGDALTALDAAEVAVQPAVPTQSEFPLQPTHPSYE